MIFSRNTLNVVIDSLGYYRELSINEIEFLPIIFHVAPRVSHSVYTDYFTRKSAEVLIRREFKFFDDYIGLITNTEIMLIAVARNPILIKIVPRYLITRRIALRCVERGGSLLKYVPNHLMTYDMAKKAVANNPNAIRYVNSEFLTHDIIMQAISKNEIKFIPDELITPEIIDKVIKRSPYMIRYLPKHKITLDNIIAVLNEDLNNYYEIPKRMRTNKNVLTKLIELFPALKTMDL